MTNATRAGRAATARCSRGVIIADDLTGAADACVAFVKRGLSGAVLFETSLAGDLPASSAAAKETTGAAVDVIAISTDSRALPPTLAADRVGAAVERHASPAASARTRSQSAEPPAPWLFKKIDSTLRGPVGAEIRAAMIAAHVGVAIVAPAFPAMGRIVDRGLLRTTGRGALPDADIIHRLSEEGLDGCVSVMRPVTRPAPVSEADDTASLRHLHALRDAWREVLSAARRGGGRVLVCDSLDQVDLDALVAAAHETGVADNAFDGPILWAGAAGLAHALAAHVTGMRGDVVDDTEPARGLEWSTDMGRRRRGAGTTSIVFAIGSTHPVTVAQQERLVRDAMPIATARVDDVAAIAQALAMRLDVIVAMPYDADNEAVARFAGLLIAREQAASASCVLVMSGGDTAARLCRELGAARIDLGGEIATGIPWGTLSPAASPGRHSDVRWPVVLKAGGFGADDSLVRVRRFLMEHHERSS